MQIHNVVLAPLDPLCVFLFAGQSQLSQTSKSMTQQPQGTNQPQRACARTFIHSSGLGTTNSRLNAEKFACRFLFCRVHAFHTDLRCSIEDPLPSPAATQDLGNLSAICDFCNCNRWPDETGSLCCFKGKVRLAPHTSRAALIVNTRPRKPTFLRDIFVIQRCLCHGIICRE